MQIQSASTRPYFQFQICKFCINSSNNSMVVQMLLRCFSCKTIKCKQSSRRMQHFNQPELIIVTFQFGVDCSMVWSQQHDLHCISTLRILLCITFLLRILKCFTMHQKYFDGWIPIMSFTYLLSNFRHTPFTFHIHFHTPFPFASSAA